MTIRTIYENAKQGIDTRQNLSLLRQEIKDVKRQDDLFELVEEDMEGICSFLNSEDAKTRKNAALLMGDLDMSDFTQPLVEAYQSVFLCGRSITNSSPPKRPKRLGLSKVSLIHSPIILKTASP